MKVLNESGAARAVNLGYSIHDPFESLGKLDTLEGVSIRIEGV
jgi:hypothetical protein